mgnify:CR=1 FL=1
MNTAISEIQDAIKETDRRVLLLHGSQGVPVDDPLEGPMTIWEAVVYLRAASVRTGNLSNEASSYCNELEKKIPKLSTTLSNLSASYLDLIPKINRKMTPNWP